MSGPSPITASFRLVHKYTVNALQHKLTTYLECEPSGDTTGWDVLVRSPFGNQGLSDIWESVFAPLVNFYNDDFTTFDTVDFDERSGDLWTTLITHNVTSVPASGAPSQNAWGQVFSGKANSGLGLSLFIYEGGFGLVRKDSSYAALETWEQNVVDRFYNVSSDAVATDPWAWRQSRNNFFARNWIASIVDTNEKLRRARGVK